MGRILLAHLQDVSLRSLVLATLAAAVLWPVWGRRSAAARHTVWSIALAGMLLLFVTAPWLPAIPLHILGEASAQVLDATTAWREIAVAIYAVVAFILLVRVAAGCWLIRGLVRAADPVDPSRSLY